MAAEALEQSMLESKDKEQLVAIAQALGIKTTARAAKATLIDKILETTRPAPAPAAANGNGTGNGAVAAAVSPAEVAAPAGDLTAVARRGGAARRDGRRGADDGDPTAEVEVPKAARAPRSNGRAAAAPPATEAAPSRRRCSAPTASRSPTGRST